MKKLLLASALTIFATNAFAGGLYISPKAGLSFEKAEDMKAAVINLGSGSDTVTHFGLAVGYDFSSFGLNLRAEGEYMYHPKSEVSRSITLAQIMSDEASFHSINANVYYDFKNSTSFTPYVGAGIGMSFIDAKLSSISHVNIRSYSDDKVNFAWNLQAGVDFAIDKHNVIGLGYRFSELGKSEIKPEVAAGTYTAEHPAHEITLSYRYTF